MRTDSGRFGVVSFRIRALGDFGHVDVLERGVLMVAVVPFQHGGHGEVEPEQVCHLVNLGVQI